MKNFIVAIVISVFLFAFVVDARWSSGGRSSGGSRSSISTSKSTSTSVRSGTSTIKTPTATRQSTTTTTNNSYSPSYGWGFGSSLMGSVVGTVAGNMVYNSLSSGQRYGEYVNDGNAQYQQILSSTGAVVWYQPVPVEEKKWLGWFWWMVIIGIFVAIIVSFFNKA